MIELLDRFEMFCEEWLPPFVLIIGSFPAIILGFSILLPLAGLSWCICNLLWLFSKDGED